MANRYSGYTATFNSAGLVINQLTAARKMSNSRILDVVPAGSVDRAAAILAQAHAACQIPTGDLATALGAVSPTAGYACSGASIFQYQQRADQGVFSGGSTNVKATAQKGFLYLGNLSAAGDGEAALMMGFVPLWDGTNEPLVFASGQALTGTAPAYVSQYFLGPVYLNGVQLPGLVRSGVDFGIGYDAPKFDGDPFPRAGSIVARRPMIKLSFEHLDMISATVGSMFHGSLGATMAIYFRKGLAGGVRVADATGAHVKISMTAGTWGAEDVGFNEEKDGTASLFVRPTAALAVSTTSTIP